MGGSLRIPASCAPSAGGALRRGGIELQRHDLSAAAGDLAERTHLGGRLRLEREVPEEHEQLLARQGLLLEQGLRDAVEHRAVLLEQAKRLRVRTVREPRLLLVTQALGL